MKVDFSSHKKMFFKYLDSEVNVPVPVGHHVAPSSSRGSTPKSPLVLPALYAFLPANLPNNITNQFLAKF